MNRRIAALALAVTALVGLTACSVTPQSGSTESAPAPTSAPPADGDGQSAADACARIQDTFQKAVDDFADAATGDPAAVADAMNDAAQNIRDAAAEVTNADVAAILPELEELFATTAEVMQGIVEGDVSAIGELAALGERFQDASARFEELCAQE